MSVKKEPIDSERIRAIPREGFSWIDRRLIRDGLIDELPPEAILLYFFLLAVSDARGLSFYADSTISERLKLDREELTQARARLIAARLILYRYPIYQVLPLPQREQDRRCPRLRRGGEPVSVNELLKFAFANAKGREDSEASRGQ